VFAPDRRKRPDAQHAFSIWDGMCDIRMCVTSTKVKNNYANM